MKNEPATRLTKKNNSGNGYEEMAEPIQIDGWWDRDVGAVLEGVAVERAESDYGPYYKIRLSAPARVKGRGEEEGRTCKPGCVVAVAENALLRQLGPRMKKDGAVSVRLQITGERPDGKGFEMKGAWKTAF